MDMGTLVAVALVVGVLVSIFFLNKKQLRPTAYYSLLVAFLASLAFSVFSFTSIFTCNFGGCGLASSIVFLLSVAASSILGMIFLLVRIFKLRAEGRPSTWSKVALLLPLISIACVVWILFGANIEQEVSGASFIGVEGQSVMGNIDKVVEVKWSKLPRGVLVVVNRKPEYVASCAPTDPGVVGSLPYSNRSQYTRRSIPILGTVSPDERYVVRLCTQESQAIESNEFRFFPK